MSGSPAKGVVVDTMVISWLLNDRPEELASRFRDVIGPNPVLLSFHTLMELRYGALRAGWGELRRRRLERQIAQLTIVQPDDAMITVCAELRQRCRQAGHALADKTHYGDRWIAATSIRVELPLVSHDGVFVAAPGVDLLTIAPGS